MMKQLAIGIGMVAALGAATMPESARAADPLVDAPPMWWEADDADIAKPAERDPNLLRDQLTTTIIRPLNRNAQPARLARRVGTLFGGQLHREAANPNALDEVPNSTWFTNRIGLFALPEAECAAALGEGPDPRGPWTVVRAKTQGVPGRSVVGGGSCLTGGGGRELDPGRGACRAGG